jgi:hypothetical protein
MTFYINSTVTAHIPEASAHDNGLVIVLLIIAEDALDTLYTGVVIPFVVLARLLLVPIKDLAERRQAEGKEQHLRYLRDQRRARSR